MTVLSPPKTRFVFGCGNPLIGDDGFGPAVIERLENHHTVPADTDCIDVGTSIRGILFDLLLDEKKPKQILLVDAVDQPGRKPGEVFEIDVGSVTPAKTTDFSPHQFPTVNMLQQIKDHTPIDVRVLVVQTGTLPSEVRPGLSPPVRDAVPVMCRFIIETLQESA